MLTCLIPPALSAPAATPTQACFRSVVALAGLALLTGAAHAQLVPAPGLPASPAGVLVISATATVEAPKDWMSLTLAVNREGVDAATVQLQLKQALEAALAEGRQQARPGQLELRSGAFSVYPRYGQKGQVTGWAGSTELVVEGKDMAAIGQISGRIGSMTIARVVYGLSREARERLEGEATGQAISRFRARAADYAKQFGYGSYSLREVNVNAESDSPTQEPRLRAMATFAKVGDAEALPVEAGKGSVSATVAGSVQLLP
jgi:predicted secreted protein